MLLYDEKCVFMIPTHNTYSDFKKQQDPRHEKKSNRGKVVRPVGCVLGDLITEIEEHMVGEQELVIVNDGSTDETEDEIKSLLTRRQFELYRENKNTKTFSLSTNGLKLLVTVVTNEENQGLFPAFVLGYEEALKKDPTYVIKLDSDGLHDPSKFPILLDRLKKDERLKYTLLEEDPPVKKGYRAIRKEVLEKIMPDLKKCSEWTISIIFQRHAIDEERTDVQTI